MAFSATEKDTIAEMFGIDTDVLGRHLLLVESNLSAETYTRIRADLVTWAANRDNFVKVHPNMANFGAEINPAEIRNAITMRTAKALTYNTDLLAGAYGRLARS